MRKDQVAIIVGGEAGTFLTTKEAEARGEKIALNPNVSLNISRLSLTKINIYR